MKETNTELAAKLEERLKLAYLGNCKCGQCQLVPQDLINEAATRLRALKGDKHVG